MTQVIRAVTPYNAHHMSLSGVTISNNTGRILCSMSNDRRTIYASGAGGATPTTTLYQSINDGGSWTTVKAFGGSDPIGTIVETWDGEALIQFASTPDYIQKSLGWAASHTAATWSTVLTAQNAEHFYGSWGFNSAHIGTNGVIVVNENGDQTGTVSGHADYGARRVYLSTDHGVNWSTIFDVYEYLTNHGANLHMHASCYDEAEDRIWIVFGDLIDVVGVCGAGNCPIGYSDDRGVTWTFIPYTADTSDCASYFPTKSMQGVGLRAMRNAIITSSDGTVSGMYIIPKLGHRSIGPIQFAIEPFYVQGFNRLVNRIEGPTGNDLMAFWCHTFASSNVEASIYGTADGGKTMHEVYSDRTVNTSTGLGNVLGPTINNKIVASYTWTNGGTFATGSILSGTLVP